jgi:NADP+-dependent farnesol dehydrogenase
MQRWAGRVAIVTGTSSGIGASIARQLVENAMKVVGVARREDKVQVCTHCNSLLFSFATFKYF